MFVSYYRVNLYLQEGIGGQSREGFISGEHFLGPGYIKALPLGKTTLKKNSQTKLKENEFLFPRTIL
jgi:hypothetical protein